MTLHLRLAIILLTVITLGSNRSVVAQGEAPPVAFGLAALVRADSAMRRAQADIRYKDVETSIKAAESATRLLDVELKTAETFWKKRLMVRDMKLQVAQQKRATQRENRALKLAATWDVLKNHPDVAGPNIRNGTALNFLLDRLDTNMLAYSYALKNNSDAQGFLNELRLTPEMLGAINLRQVTQSGTVIFRADGQGLDLNWWPFLLRVESLRQERQAVEDANSAIERELSEKHSVSPETVIQLGECLQNLTNAFHRKYPSAQLRSADTQVILQYVATDRFLKSKKTELFRMPETVNGRRSGFDPKREGDHLVAMLTYMARNGLDFAPPAQGNEHIYEQLFRMMRDLSATDSMANELEQKLDLKPSSD